MNRSGNGSTKARPDGHPACAMHIGVMAHPASEGGRYALAATGFAGIGVAAAIDPLGACGQAGAGRPVRIALISTSRDRGFPSPMITKKDVARQFGRMSKAYASSPGHASGADLDVIVEFLNPSPGMLVLDIATGAGHTALRVAPHVKQVLAVDLSKEMLGQTLSLASSRVIPNVACAVMDAEELALPDESCDAVTCRIAPHHFQDPSKSLREIARVLKPGGAFVLEDSLVPADPLLDPFLNEIELMRDPTHVRSYTFAEWREMIRAAGLAARSLIIHRKRHDIGEWLDRAGMTEAAVAAVRQRLNAAPRGARDYYEMTFEDGHAVTFTDDKLIVRAEKR